MRTQAIGAGFEGLEERLLLAGNMTSVLAAGVLILDGDLLANQVQLTVASNGQLTATGLSGTTIDGLASKNFGAVHTLTVNGGAGDDKISLTATAASIANDVTIDGGADNNTLSVTGRFGSDLILTGADGNDTITVNKATVGVDLDLDAGLGNDKVTVSGSTISQDFLLQTREGNDSVNLNGTSIHRDLILADTDGSNSLRITNTSTRNDAILALGAGNDTLVVNGLTSGVRTGATAQGLISIDFGEGKNVLSMSNSKAVGTGLGDGIQLLGGSGNDFYGILDSQSAGGILIDTGDGANRIEMTQVTISGIGDLSLETGLGEDSVKLDRLSVGGFTQIDTGLGNDIFQLTNSRFTRQFGGNTVVNSATLGGGDDIAYLSGNFFAARNSQLSGGVEVVGDVLHLGSNNTNNNFAPGSFEFTRFGKLPVSVR